jgi:uncharacterized protein with PIN domain
LPCAARETDSPPKRLLADAMLGRLARWLRLMGYDTAYDNAAEDDELARRSRAEDRVLLTRDRELANRVGLRTLLIESEELEEQIAQVRDAIGAAPVPTLSRCSVCNEPLEEVGREEAAGSVPPYVLRAHAGFRRCPRCKRIYWKGSHVEGMERQVDSFGQ